MPSTLAYSVIGFRCAFGAETREILYGEKVRNNGKNLDAKMERLRWGNTVGHFVGKVFTNEEFTEEARKFVAANGPCLERGPIHDEALRNRFFAWCSDIAVREKRWERLKSLPPRPPSPKRLAIAIKEEIRRLTKDERLARRLARRRERQYARRSANLPKHRESNRAWYRRVMADKDKREQALARMRAAHRTWSANHPDKVRADALAYWHRRGKYVRAAKKAAS